MKMAPRIRTRHRLELVQWVKAVSESWAVNSKKAVFSNEKNFNLYGPDALDYYWHDIRREKKYFEKRQQGGESLMVWGTISYYGANQLATLEGMQDSGAYRRTR